MTLPALVLVRSRRIAMAVAGLSLWGAAHAGRPLQTEDAGVLDAGACESEAVAARESAGGASALERVVQVGCGVGANTQLAVALSRIRDDAEALRGVAAGGKTQLWRSDEAAFTLAYSVARIRPAGDRRHATGAAVNLVVTRQVSAQASLHLNLGHERDAIADLRATTWGIALEHAGFGPVAPMAEVFGDDRGAPWWNAALRWTLIADRLFLDGSYGRQVSAGRPRLVTLGAKFAF